MDNRPIDMLAKARGKRVIARLKNGSQVSGKIMSHDMHINMWLEDAELTDAEGKAKKIDKLLIRGDNVVYVSPAKK